jgi:hypothetical protein
MKQLLGALAIGATIFGTGWMLLWMIRRPQKQRAKRTAALEASAQPLGLSFSATDTLGIEAMLSFPPFDAFDKREAVNVMSGVWDGLEVRVFDHRYWVSGQNSNQWVYRMYAMAERPETLPRVAINRRAVSGPRNEIPFESEEFSRWFNVQAEEPAAGVALVDERMMAWLLSLTYPWRFLVCKNVVLVTGDVPLLKPQDIPAMLATLKAFNDHVPGVAGMYGTTNPGRN